jgi:hypothetical protein
LADYCLETGAGYDVTSTSVQRMPRHQADVSPRFLLTGERPKAGEPWREAFARILTADPQFARATVNMIWAELMGTGIVDPPFSFDLARQDPANLHPGSWSVQPSNPKLLDALAADFRAHHFDLRYLIRLITTSGTYQISSHFDGDWRSGYEPYFARRVVRRLPPEMIAGNLHREVMRGSIQGHGATWSRCGEPCILRRPAGVVTSRLIAPTDHPAFSRHGSHLFVISVDRGKPDRKPAALPGSRRRRCCAACP